VGVRNSLGSVKWLCHFSYLTLKQSSAYPQNIDTRFSKSLMRTNQAMLHSMNLRCRLIFNVTIAINDCDGYFQELQRCQNHRQRLQRGAEKRCKFSDAPQKRGQTCASRDYQGEGAGKEQPTEGYFRTAKIREQRL
jgi:hypothetical protein